MNRKDDTITDGQAMVTFHSLADEKQLLTDPVKYFTNTQPENKTATDTISRLYQQRLILEQKQKKLHTQTGVLSRQIGTAKRNNQPIDKLLTAMKTLSAEKKSLNQQIKQINQAILQNSFYTRTDKVDDPSMRLYPETNCNIEAVTISLLDDDSNNTPTDNIMQSESWNHYVTANPAACIHHRTEWRNIHQHSYGHNSIYLYARNNQQKIVGILPLVHIKSRLFGNQLVSMPFFQRGGAVADNPQIEQKLMQVAAKYGHKLDVDHIEYRDDIAHGCDTDPLPVETHKVNMVLSLPETDRALWKTFGAKLRSQIRRAQREPTQVFIGRDELLDDFYRVYSHNMRDLGSPVQSKKFIKNILATFPQNSWLIVIRYQQRPVATGCLLGSDNTLEIPLASTLRSVNPLSLNMLLYWEVLKFAIDKNFEQFDFGRSSKNGGTYRFKQQWGAKPMQLYWHYWLGKAGQPPSRNASNPKYATVINVWKHLPLAFTNILGPLIVKNIP